MNVVVLPIVVTVVLLSILGVYSASTNSEYDVARTSMDSMAQAAERRNEIIHAVMDGQSLTVANHGMRQSGILMMDFRMNNGTINRATFSDNAFFDGHTPTKEIHRNPDEAPTVSSGAEIQIDLAELGINYQDVSSASITSEKGNRFLVDVPAVSSSNGSNNSGSITPVNTTKTETDPTGQGRAMIDGMGLQARIIQIDFEDDSMMTFGRGVAGEDVSLKPYIEVNQDTDFAALVKDTENPEVYAIPEFWHQYMLGSNGMLTDMTAEAANVLGYTGYRVLSGNVDVSIGGSGNNGNNNNNNNNDITVTGSGRAVLQLNDYQGQSLVLRGDAGSGTAKMITSDVSLLTAPYHTRGFLTYSASIDPAPDSFRVRAGLDSAHTGIFEYDQTYRERHQHHCKCAIHIHPNEVNHVTTHVSLVKRDSADHTTITGDSTTPANISPTYSTTPLGTENFSFKLYDTLPSYRHLVLQDTFEAQYTFPQGVSYLYVEPNGGTVTLKAEQHTNTPFLKIVNVTPDTPYRVIKDGHTIAAGMSDHTGRILVGENNNDSYDGEGTTLAGGMLHLYRDALTYRGHLETLVFDDMHRRVISLDTSKNEIYTVHMYVRIPVTGTVSITDTSLDGTQSIPYIDGDYNNGDSLNIPVLPGFDAVHMRINGIQASLRYAEILGSTGITIAESKTSQITQNSVSSPIRYAESAAGTLAFAIATADGRLKAVISETISGSISITNTYRLQAVPPPPPAIPRDDPLTGEVDIFVNGIFREHVTLGINPYPDFAFASVRQGSDVVQSVRYSYPQHTLAGTASIDVRAGDMVEFYVYSKIHGAISRYVPPDGHVVVQSYGTSVAIAAIQSAHINTDM